MKVNIGQLYGVMTGDIVSSSDLPTPERKRLHDVMTEGGTVLKSYFGPRMPLPLDIFSGDGWQVLLDQPVDLLRAALLYRVYIRSHIAADTRVVMAIGTVDFVPKSRVSEGEGVAFQRSGRLLRELKGRIRMRFTADDDARWHGWDAAVQALDALVVQSWNDKRSRALTGALRGMKQQEIALLWDDDPIRQQTVQRHLQRAGWEWVEPVLARFEKSLSAITEVSK
jgi:hypothetical protein